MASSFAAQLRSIAQNSTHELNLQARRTAHAESLLFTKEVAAKQDYETIYAICVEGFREICLLDPVLVEFERNLFGAHSVTVDRDELNADVNNALNKAIERFLAILGSKLLLKPGVRCLEWLIRRFRAHVHNTTAVLLAVLPWHEMAIWRNVLSIIPKDRCTGEWKFLGLYKGDALNVPRGAVVHAMATNDGFFALFNRHVMDNVGTGVTDTGLVKFWTGVMIEAVIRRLDGARSGRREIQRQQTEDLLLKVLPLLSEGFEVRKSTELRTACYTLAMVLAVKANLGDRVLDSLLHTVAVAIGDSAGERVEAVVTSVVIIDQKQDMSVPKATVDLFMGLSDLGAIMAEVSRSHQLQRAMEALMNGAVRHMKRRDVTNRLALVEKLLRFSETASPALADIAIEVILKRILELRAAQKGDSTIHTGLLEILQRLHGERDLAPAISAAWQKLGEDSLALEALFDSPVAKIEETTGPTVQLTTLDTETDARTDATSALQQIPSRTVHVTLFLTEDNRELYNQLAECFDLCCRSPSDLQSFIALPLWRSSSPDNILFGSFLLRSCTGPTTNRVKSTALRLLTQMVKGSIDPQISFPYLLTALMDPSLGVRKSAAELLVASGTVLSDDGSGSRSDGLIHLHGDSSISEVKLMEPSHFAKVVNDAFLPSLEECVLDASHVARTIRHALNGGDADGQTEIKTKTKSSGGELKKTLRHELFDLLTSHAVSTSIVKVKISIIRLLEQVDKVGTGTKSKALATVLENWSRLTEAAAQEAAQIEHLSLSEIDNAMMDIVTVRDKDFLVGFLSRLGEKDAVHRADFIRAFFDRIQTLWKGLKHDAQVSYAHEMFGLAFSDRHAVANGAQGALRSAALTTDILGTLLELSTGAMVQHQAEESHPKKKRRTSHGRESIPSDLLDVVRLASARLTLALELIDDAQPETRPELLPALFDTLSTLRRLKQQQRLDLTYLNSLCLSNILAIVEGQQHLGRRTIDLSSIRADLVTDYVRTAENPQVQNIALSICTSLASIAPDRMVHDVMPIFTFMGQSMFSKDDEHSIHVVNEAIDKIIPALIDSLREQNKDLVRSTSSLLTSFVAVFDHIPQYRRVAMYVRLLNRMGTDDFGFVVICMLAQRKASSSSFKTFLEDVLAEMTAGSQLVTFERTIGLAMDLLLPEPQLAGTVLGLTESTSMGERNDISKTLFRVASKILDSKTLQSQTNKLHKLKETAAAELRVKIDVALQLILSVLRDLKMAGSERVEEAKQCLEGLLRLPPLRELFKILSDASTSAGFDDDLKPQTLRVLAAQLQGKPDRGDKTSTAAVELLGNLAAAIKTESSVPMKQAIVVCIDRLCEVYGRKEIDAVVSAANAVSGEQCLGSTDERLQVMSLFCLASILDVAGEACVPIVPRMLSRVESLFNLVLQGHSKKEEMHNAVFTLIAAVMAHVSFIVPDQHLEELLPFSSLAATQYASLPAVESRKEALSAVARNIDLGTLLSVLSGEHVRVTREHPKEAQLESLDLLSTALETASKTKVVQNADKVSLVLLAQLDQRARLFSSAGTISDEESQVVSTVEDKIKSVSIQYIYKVNDTVFRPIFESWIEWAAHARDVEDTAAREKMMSFRRASLFGLLTHFFDTLKSIVTSYAAYAIPLVHQVLKETSSHMSSKKAGLPSMDLDLYTASLKLLRSTFAHDVDAFYSIPSHFDLVGPSLISQLHLAAFKALRETTNTKVIPTIVSLATATVDAPSHHQILSHELVQLRHSTSAAVRLASIRVFAAITADDDVGDEFIANVIGIGSEGAVRGTGGAGSVGEVMIYVNEMLEDDDEDVAREVRRWVQVVREKTGEDVFEV